MAKKRKKRQKKIYNVKELQEKWKLQRFDEKKYYDRMRTILAIIGASILLFSAIISCFVIGIYKPIKKEEAICRSAQFHSYHSYITKTSSHRYIKLDNQESINIPKTYHIENDLQVLEPNTTLTLKLHQDGTVLEIKTAQKEILNFDYAQKQLLKRSIFIFVLGILCFLGMVACTVYAMIKIIRYKVFAPSKNIYKRR